MKRRIPLKWVRNWQIIKYGWKDAGEIAKMPDVGLSRWKIFKDIRLCFQKYYLFSNVYKRNRVWALNEEERQKLGDTLGDKERRRDLYMDFYHYYWQNMRFLEKYSSLKYSRSKEMVQKRIRAYVKHYGLSDDVYIQYGVTLICEHMSVGKITMGKKVLLARNVDIDFTGDITIGNGVSFSEGVKVLTHNHDFFGLYDDSDLVPKTNRAHVTPLIIEDNVLIGAHSIIMPDVRKIGENSMISANSVVTKEVPPNVIVAGNPAKVVGKIPKGSRIYFRADYH